MQLPTDASTFHRSAGLSVRRAVRLACPIALVPNGRVNRLRVKQQKCLQTAMRYYSEALNQVRAANNLPAIETRRIEWKGPARQGLQLSHDDGVDTSGLKASKECEYLADAFLEGTLRFEPLGETSSSAGVSEDGGGDVDKAMVGQAMVGQAMVGQAMVGQAMVGQAMVGQAIGQVAMAGNYVSRSRGR
ncbi:hypothetical protein IAR50_004374 [Cryptococcus sp. DSM 104548]